MRGIKKSASLGLTLIGACALWFSTIYWVPLLAKHILQNAPECSDRTSRACGDILSSLGATGDLFGAVTSLFSGLALFSVALTLWNDTKSRREARKPLVAAYLDADSIILDDAKIKPDREISIKVSTKIKNLTSDAAINVRVAVTLSYDHHNYSIEEHHLEAPLASGVSEEVRVQGEIKGDFLNAFLAALTTQEHHVRLNIRTTYQSLEKVDWTTAASYRLTCGQQSHVDRLNAVRNRAENFAALWSNGAAVALNLHIEKGSWEHRQT